MTDKRRSVLFVFLASVCFSTGGLFIKLIPWSALAINGARNLIGAAVIVLAMYYKHKTMLWLAVCYAALSILYTPLHLMMLSGAAGSTVIRVAYSLTSSIAEIILIVYLFKWAKRVKES